MPLTIGVSVILAPILFVNSAVGNCRYQNRGDLPPDIFSYWSDWGCYNYTRPDLWSGQPLQASKCFSRLNGTQYEYPGLIRDEECIPFSHQNEFIRKSVERTFLFPDNFEKWHRCCLDAEFCCKNVMMMSSDVGAEDVFCPSIWDGWSCFDEIPAGTVYRQVCSQYAYGNKPPLCHHYSSRQCFSNGTWGHKTDYSSCDITPRLIFRTAFHMTALSISIIVCIPAISMLSFYPSLRTEKLTMVRNLLIVLVLRNFFVIIVKGTLILDELTTIGATAMSENNWSCRMLSVLEKFFGTAVFTCMLMEGIYLYQMLTNVFRARLRGGLKTAQLYIGGFVITTAVTLAWSLVMALNEKKHCWQVTEGTDFHWIFDGPRLVMLIMNFALLIRIVCALWSTFNLRQEEQHPLFRTAKAGLICLPLFGVPFLFLLVRPATVNCGLEQFYYITYYSVEALQGVLIATLHCYLEREIKTKICGKLRWLQRKCCDFYSKADTMSANEASRRRRPTSDVSRSSTSRSSIQSRRESDTSASTLTTPQVDNREKFMFPLPRIQEDDERNISHDINTSRMLKHSSSTGNLTPSASEIWTTGQDPGSRRHSADGSDRYESSF